MTNERAIELLHRISDSQFDGIHGDERREALSMAVRALEQNLVKESGGLVKDLVKDCISRQQAIDVLKGLPTWWADGGGYYGGAQPPMVALLDPEDAVSAIENLPSAQPETHDKRTETHECDLIGRQEAIDALDKHIDTFDAIDTNYLCGLRTAMSILKEMPSAQPETHDKRTETQINTLDCVSRQVAIDALTELRKKTVASDSFRLGIYYSIEEIKNVPSAQLDSQEIGYWECSNALLKMWIDNVLTDGEYYRIADKLNTYWKDKIRGKNGE